jgi:hypothetical protein
MVAAGVLVCIDLGSVGPQNANASELQFDGKTGSFSDKNSFKSQVGDPAGWLTVKLDGTVWDMHVLSAAPSYDPLMFKSVSLMAEPAPLEWNHIPAEQLADIRATVGMWDDRVRWTSRQAVSSYITTPGTSPGTNTAYLMRSFDNAASSQRLDTTIWKAGSTWLLLFAEYDQVGANFQAPNVAIKPQDPFSTSNSMTTRLGGAFQQGPITLTLEQRTRQSLAQDNAPTKLENLVGISLGFDELWGRSRWIPEGIAWTVPTSAYVTVGQGRVRAALNQGVNGDTMSDVSAGFLWGRNKVFASLGYWRSDYQSELYPWRGLGIDGSVGYHVDRWAIDLYFDVYNSVTSYSTYSTAVQPAAGVKPSTSQSLDVIASGLVFSGRF